MADGLKRRMADQKVAIVTGGNSGIGREAFSSVNLQKY
jgi:NADP-dependent 3-hydroxy acid dehydrogenase YdfG